MGTKSNDWYEDVKQDKQTMAPDNPVSGETTSACKEEPASKTRGFWMWSGSVRIRVDVPDEFRDIMNDTEISNSTPWASKPFLPENALIAELDAHKEI